MTRTELRTRIVNDAAKALNHAVILRLEDETVQILVAEQTLFSNDDDALEKIYQLLPARLRSE